MSKAKVREPGKIVGHTDRQLFPDVASKAYVDHQMQIVQHGVLKHAVVEIVNAPPASPKPGMYIVGQHPTGDFAAKAGKIVMHIPGFGGSTGTWVDVAAGDKEERLVESENALYQYDSATNDWIKVAVAAPIDKLAQLTDVSATTPTDKQVLTYNATTKKWGGASAATASGGSTFGYQNNVGHFDVTKPAGSVEYFEAELDVWLIGGSGNTFPSFEFLGFQPFQVEDANWHSSTHFASNVAHDSAPTSYINTNNVTGNSIKLGYIGGGTGHSLASNAMHVIKIRAKKIHGSKTFFTGEYFGARKSDSYPVFHQFKAIVGQSFANLTGLRMTIASNAFTCDAQIKGE